MKKRAPELPAEELLIKREVLELRSARQRQVLGCITCILNNPERSSDDDQIYPIYSAKIRKCLGTEAGTVAAILRRFARGGALETQREVADATNAHRPLRTCYRIVRTDLGADLLEQLEVPPTCGLTKELPDAADTSPEVPELSNVDQAMQIISTSSREELREIIAGARRQIRRLDKQQPSDAD